MTYRRLDHVDGSLATGGPTPRSVFDRVFDVVVVGSGYAGYAAATALRDQGRTVLLIGPRGDLLWESGRAFCPDLGTCDAPRWRDLVAAVAGRGGRSGDWIDGAITEVVGTDRLATGGTAVLYYARPVAVERAGEAVCAVVVATKTGTRRVAARQWVDATETGELLRLIQPDLVPKPAARTDAYLLLQHPDWSCVGHRDGLRSTAWPSERVLGVEVTACDPAWRGRVVERLERLERDVGAEIGRASMSHWSFEPISRYAAGSVTAGEPPNVTSAAPALALGAVTTLADRFVLGLEAVQRLTERDAPEPPSDVLSRPLPPVRPVRTIAADVCVAGTGTGGSFAAFAAALAGSSVACLEAQVHVGGIGTGGGIHGYWFGTAGGLQTDVDRRTREMMKRFSGGPFGDGPFNPWAKMLVLEQLLRERGAEVTTDALLFAVETAGDRVRAVLAATPEGVVRVEAAGFVDGTGDGDLCGLAGAEFTLGRDYDGLPHAYSQSSGRLREVRGRPRMDVVNFDAGFCDPTDPDDLTRARLAGVAQYLLDGYDNLTRPTYIAPSIGLRQGRSIVTEYTLTLDDQIRRRRFDDAVGFTGGHFDSHFPDYESDSDEALFWIWANRQLPLLVACEVSYRTLVPRGLGNVWIASRCLGVTQDAHYLTRLQRDMQRLGEAAGFAAAEAARLGLSSAELPYAQLRKWLDHTGALAKEPRAISDEFGSYPFGGDPANPALDPSGAGRSSAARALAALDRGEPGEAIWWLYRHQSLVHDEVAARAEPDAGPTPMTSWLAACTLAMWQDPAAEPRLIHALRTREYGFGAGYEWSRHGHFKVDDRDPLDGGQVAPVWLCALALLRRCGSAECLPAIEELLDHPVHGIDTLITAAITVERLGRRGVADDEQTRGRLERLLDRVLAVPVLGAVDRPGRPTGQHSENALRHGTDAAQPAPPDGVLGNTLDDAGWQLHLAVARARLALGGSVHPAAWRLADDPRAPVRHAFALALRESVHGPVHGPVHEPVHTDDTPVAQPSGTAR